MSEPTRREFVRRLGIAAGAGTLAPAWAAGRLDASPAGAAAGSAGAAGTLAGRAPAGAGGPLIRVPRALPVAISSANGLPAVERAMEVLAETGDTLEAAVSGVNLVEEDPEDMTVGYGGLPNADGVVQLDSQVYHGPTRGVGAVAALEGFINPSRVAVAVMRYTDHVLLVGEGAARFAREMGFPEQDLLPEATRLAWLRWRARLSEEDDYLGPEDSGEPIRSFRDPGGPGALEAPERERRGAAPGSGADRLAGGMLDSWDGSRPWGTIHVTAVNAEGQVSAVTTTSGLFFKVPGRVGDSPLPGCGCYCDNDVGGAGSTGRGEAVIKTVGAHTITEEMRRGAHPTDACLTALRRIVDWTVERRLLRDDGRPNFNVNYYAANVRGDHGAAALWSGPQHAVHDGREGRLADSAYLFERD